MCLSQDRNDRTWDTGKMCVRKMEFIAVEEVIGEFAANGVIGLAPSDSKISIIDQL